ncbi:MAG: hypothetical protein ACERK0_00340 [Deltaproteobacteria bacterium]|jgi:hypothetical protein
MTSSARELNGVTGVRPVHLGPSTPDQVKNPFGTIHVHHALIRIVASYA